MPESQQQYNIEELENAAAYAVHEVEKIAESLQAGAGLNIAAHSPEAAWSDPVQALEALGDGALYARLRSPEGLSLFLMPPDDAAFFTALLLGLPAEEVPAKVKQGVAEEEVELLLGALGQVFAPRGVTVESPELHTSRKDLAEAVENDLGVSFLAVKTEVSPEGFSDCLMVRIYSPQFAAKFSTRPGTSALDTQAVPALVQRERAAKEEAEEEAKAAAVRADEEPRPPNALLRIPVKVTVRMAGKSVSVRDLLEMLPGAVVEFERKVDEEVELLVNDHVVAKGEAVRSGRKYGIRITSVAPVEKRVGSLRRRSAMT